MVAAAVLTSVWLAAPASATLINCDPSSTGWNVKGQFPDGAVMEARACGEDIGIDGRVFSEWRLRKGGTAISNAVWDMNSLSDSGYTAMQRSWPTAGVITFRDYDSDITGSYIKLSTPYDCDHTYSSGNYYGGTLNVRVWNPGTNTKSGYKDQGITPASMTIGC
jgi:hypothetical protein